MAWEHPHHICGHEGERIQMYGPTRDRRRRLAAIEAQPCPDCRAEAARAEAQATGLPELKGTPKQVAWAADIRHRIMESLVGTRASIATLEQPMRDQVDQALAGILSQASAQWWIEHTRSYPRLSDLLRSEWRRLYPSISDVLAS